MSIKKRNLKDGSTAISFVDKKGNDIDIAIFGDEIRFWKDGVLKGTLLYTQESINDSDIIQTLTDVIVELLGSGDFKGRTGDSAYDLALINGFVGTIEEWLLSLVGDEGASAYEVAVAGGFVGTEAQWLASLKGEKGEPGGAPDLISYLQKTEAEETYATLEQVGNIDIVLDILNGDLDGDLDLEY